MKIWIKLLIAGVVMFFAGVFIIAGFGLNSSGGIGGMVLSTVGGIIFVVGLLAGLTRGFNRMMRE